MRILALETSTEWCSVAVGDGAHWHVRSELAGHAHSERLLPMVGAALAEAGWTLPELDGVAFGAGPGSFTGIRIGCGVAQGLSLGADRPVVPVPTLMALAQGAFREHGWGRVIGCLDARMREVYAAAYARDRDSWREVAAPVVAPPSGIFGAGLPDEDAWAGAGNGFAAYPMLSRQLLLSRTDEKTHPGAQAIAELAIPILAAGSGVAAADAMPLYVRHRVALTAAEQEAGVKL